MDIMELGAIGELVGGVAVIVTLIYLALQVRNGAQEQRAASMSNATHELATVAAAFASEEGAAVFLDAMDRFDSLETRDRLRFSGPMVHYIRVVEQLYYQYQDGRVPPQIWNGFLTQLRDYAAYQGFQSWWRTRSHWYEEPFRSVVESQVTGSDRPRLYGEES
jgi:hypothetical protein